MKERERKRKKKKKRLIQIVNLGLVSKQREGKHPARPKRNCRKEKENKKKTPIYSLHELLVEIVLKRETEERKRKWRGETNKGKKT